MRATSQKLQLSKISPNLESLCTAATKRNQHKSLQVIKARIIFLLQENAKAQLLPAPNMLEDPTPAFLKASG